MLRRNSSYGSFVALITPFTSRGRLDRKALETLVEWHIAEKTDGIICHGCTGESATLSRLEKKTVLEICVKVAASRVPIVAGSGTCDTRETVRHTEDALKLGASACLIITPYFNKPSQRGCLAHFREVAKVGLSIIAYHNPPRTIFRFSKETLYELAAIPEVVAFKDSGRDLDLIQDLFPKIAVLSGDDDLTLQVIEQGGKGVISVIGNVIPRGWGQMVRFSLARDARAKVLFERYLPLCQGNFLETNPQCVKYLVSQMGRCQPVLRLPLQLPMPATQKTLRDILWNMALINRLAKIGRL
jgi:4-hydroxy-tetrahydrodipicolinate synthase